MKGWRILFGGAAAYNFAIVLLSCLSPAGGNDGLVITVFVAAFGILYAIVSRDPMRLGPALWAGVAGKTGVILAAVPLILSGEERPGLGFILAGDGLFTLGFLAFLLGPFRRAERA